jgi:hypothetical protein
MWLAAGYGLAIITWRYIRRLLTGIEAEISALRARLRILETKIRSK